MESITLPADLSEVPAYTIMQPASRYIASSEYTV